MTIKKDLFDNSFWWAIAAAPVWIKQNYKKWLLYAFLLVLAFSLGKYS